MERWRYSPLLPRIFEEQYPVECSFSFFSILILYSFDKSRLSLFFLYRENDLTAVILLTLGT